jgi:hypothetical protein
VISDVGESDLTRHASKGSPTYCSAIDVVATGQRDIDPEAGLAHYRGVASRLNREGISHERSCPGFERIICAKVAAR